MLEAKSLRGSNLQGSISHRPQIGTAETGKEVDVGGPAPDTGNRHQRIPDFVVGLVRKGIEIERTIDNRLCQDPQVSILLPGDAVETEFFGGGGQHQLRRHRSDSCQNLGIRRRGRCQRNLLFEDEEHETGKAWWPLPVDGHSVFGNQERET